MVRILFCLTPIQGVSMKIVRMTMLSLLLLMIALPLYAGGRLTYYCSTDIPWCELMKKEVNTVSRILKKCEIETAIVQD